MEIVDVFVESFHSSNVQSWKSSRMLCEKPKFFAFSICSCLVNVSIFLFSSLLKNIHLSSSFFLKMCFFFFFSFRMFSLLAFVSE